MFLICFFSGVSELNYISQIVIMMYEDPTKVSKGSPHYFICFYLLSLVTESPFMYWLPW